ncbi:MAG: UDP-3-O-(3-hydroxymyristoyl)glucosamine N-acyltransferase [Candidatus Omnitrophota bacterium]
MKIRLKEIAELVDGKIIGDENIVITGVNGIKEAQEGDITFIANPKYESLISSTRASAIIVPDNLGRASAALVCTENPSLAFSKVIAFMYPQENTMPSGIHPQSIIGRDVKLGENVALGPYVVVEDGSCIGDNTIICAGSFIGRKTSLGRDCLVYPNVTIREKAQIGDRVIIHSGTVVGSDGFGFAEAGGVHCKIPQVGIVLIEDDVEIGACVSIDRARFGKTRIGRGTKIDNLVQIAHNVTIGEDSIIVSQAGISGSSSLGKRVIMAGQSGVVGHITLGDNVIVGAQAGVTKSVPPNSFVVGSPARPHNEAKKIFAGWNKLPRLIKEVNDIKDRLERLETRTKG